MTYKTTVEDNHERDEELQWAEILSSGNEAAGMTLVFIQKLCTAFHEFDPAFNAAVLKDELEFFRKRLLGRTNKVIEVMQTNSLDSLHGFSQLAATAEKIPTASMSDLAEMAEEIHVINHLLCDSLQEYVKK